MSPRRRRIQMAKWIALTVLLLGLPFAGVAVTGKLPNGTDLFVWRAAVADGASAAPGTILEAFKRLLIATGERPLELTEVQLPGKRPLPAADFLCGARLEAGATLGAT